MGLRQITDTVTTYLGWLYVIPRMENPVDPCGPRRESSLKGYIKVFKGMIGK